MRAWMMGGSGMEDIVRIARPRMSGLRSAQSYSDVIHRSARPVNPTRCDMRPMMTNREETGDGARDFFGP